MNETKHIYKSWQWKFKFNLADEIVELTQERINEVEN